MFSKNISSRFSTLLASVPVVLALAAVSSQAVANCAESGGASSVKKDRGQVLDYSTDLTWQRCSVGKTWDEASAQCTGSARSMTWDAAIEYVKGLKPSADGMWRLPTPIELMTLIDSRCRGGDRRLKWFGDSDAKVLWSSVMSQNRKRWRPWLIPSLQRGAVRTSSSIMQVFPL